MQKYLSLMQNYAKALVLDAKTFKTLDLMQKHLSTCTKTCKSMQKHLVLMQKHAKVFTLMQNHAKALVFDAKTP